MPIQLPSENGKVLVSDEVISILAGFAALDCYGLVGMASRKQLKDGITELLGRENLGRGVEVRRENDEVVIDLYVIVSYGTKISEVAHNIKQKVQYTLNEVVGLHIDQVNIIVQGVRITR